ncbi:MAG: ABC transporter permease [Candidatus Bathyarchaeota archaeon]|nr:ABC transporter permease [Candidatus Bathyarchaeota archaeon]
MASAMLDGFVKAVVLILSGDPVLVDITLRSLAISGLATIAASLWSIPLGALIGLGRFKGRVLLRGLFNALLGVPTVTLGLVLYLLISKSGPLGFLRLLYTPTAIILGQAILITPIIVSFVASTLEAVDPDVRSLALTLGSTETGAALTILNESMEGVLLSVTAGFNRAIAELGVALMVGGNIRGVTRVLTTYIALETGRGEIALGIAFAIILLSIVGVVNLTINLIQRRLK